MKEIIYKQFCDQFDSFKNNLKELNMIESTSDNLVKVSESLDFVINLADSFGLTAYTLLDNRIGIVEYGSGSETLGLLVHVDVVPANKNEWDYPPYDLSEDQGILYGRGVVDDKGPCLMMLYILKIIKDLNIKTNRKIQMIIGTQEEVEWTDMNDYVKEFPLPNFGFTPDGEFPIQNAEKGYLDLKLSFVKDNISSISAGSATNSIPSDFDCTIDGVEYSAKGKACHSSVPEEGINAIFKGIEQIPKEKWHPMFSFLYEYFQDINGEKMGIYEENYVNNGILNLTVLSPTLIKEENNKIDVYINFRLGLANTYDKIIKFLDSKKSEYGFEYEIMELMQPIYVDENQMFIQSLKKEYEDVMNLEMKFDLAFGTSYAKAMHNFVSFGPLFPGAIDTCHEANEQLSIEDLFLAQKIYINSIYELIS